MDRIKTTSSFIWSAVDALADVVIVIGQWCSLQRHGLVTVENVLESRCEMAAMYFESNANRKRKVLSQHLPYPIGIAQQCLVGEHETLKALEQVR